MSLSSLRSHHRHRHRLLLLLLLLLSSISFSSQQNFQAFFPPNSIPAFPSAPPPAIPSSPAPTPSPREQPIVSPPSPQSIGISGGRHSNGSVALAVVSTAFGSFVVCAVLFFFLHRRTAARHRLAEHNGAVVAGGGGGPKANGHSGRNDGGYDMKILDSGGLDAFYLKRLDEASRKLRCSRCSRELDEADREALVVRVSSVGEGRSGEEEDDRDSGRRHHRHHKGRRRKEEKQQQENALLGRDDSRSDDLSWTSDEYRPQQQQHERPAQAPRPPRRGYEEPPPWANHRPPFATFESTPPPPSHQQHLPHRPGHATFGSTPPPQVRNPFVDSPTPAASLTVASPPSSGRTPPPNPPLPLPPGRAPPSASPSRLQSASAIPGGGSPPPPSPPGSPPLISSQTAPPPPPPPARTTPGAPPPPPPPGAPPPPPPPGGKPGTPPGAPPPPPPPGGKAGGGGPPPPPPPRPGGPPPPPGKGPPPPPGTSRPPPAPPGSGKSGEIGVESPRQRGQLPPPQKLRPLHWDKMNAVNPEHSMVWDRIHDGSFRVDDDLMVTLFGTMANRKPSDTSKSGDGPSTTATPAQIVLLDPRKSQNTAIVLRSLAISRQEILEALQDGHGLSTDTLEKLSKIAPTKEEESTILGYSGDPTKLADAESFLFHLLRAVQAPFSRIDSILFKSTFNAEAAAMKESLQVMEAACGELKKKGLFMKLLEAVLKAGNRMNAGTAKGNAKAFNLASLRKLSDVKSTDGKTTLLHFVVEEVTRLEGRRAVLNRDRGFGKNSNAAATTAGKSGGEDNAGEGSVRSREEEREYMMLGLPIVGGLSSEFTNVKRTAGIDFDTLVQSWAVVDARLRRSRQFLGTFKNGANDTGFFKEMKQFLESAEGQVKEIEKEKERIMDLVRRTTEYYHPGASKEKGLSPLHLFSIVKDFLGMVDQACIDITRTLQLQQQQQQLKKKLSGSGSNVAAGSSIAAAGADSPSNSGRILSDKFPNLPKHFLSDHLSTNSSAASGSDSDEDDFSP